MTSNKKTLIISHGLSLVVVLIIMSTMMIGCRTPVQHRVDADETAAEIISQKQTEALGRTSDFTIERPAETLRRRLMVSQNLPYSSPASMGTGTLEKIEHWPEDDYPSQNGTSKTDDITESNGIIRLTLVQALQVGAYNNFGYQTAKEEIFKKALALDLERNDFRNIFNAQLQNQLSHDTDTDTTDMGNSGWLLC
jgi:hypothetical protein